MDLLAKPGPETFVSKGTTARRKILIIDDDRFWHKLLKQLLARDYDVYSAANCGEGVDLVKAHKPDCILLDFHLPDGDAVSACLELRKNAQKPDTPVIVVSFDLGAEVTAYTECRAAYFVRKGSQRMLALPALVGKLLLPAATVP